ncbi:2OG-Fe(II) oxygenase [Tumidithrix elongata RA019]|uniref:2OG-Fe(II) oxygenase n=1 Tax=Tumidithrix elongata BACA0141 TaxID=2716417 RepID=A0AAW9PZX3_9CYAN|nr:2OG-Fe(II) oxygenase [Tumidithrix elongata RA019]
MVTKEKAIQKSSPIKQKFSPIKIDALLKRLDLVKHLAESDYWITTEELGALLDFDASLLEWLNQQEPLYSFSWRNFIVTQQGYQNHARMWAIADQPQKPRQVSIAPERKQPLIQPVSNSEAGRIAIVPEPLKLKSEKDEGEVFPSSYFVLENFLSPQELTRFLQYTQSQAAKFVPATISTQDVDYRRTKVLHDFPEFSQLLINRMMAIAPQVVSRLGIQNFTPSSIEAQLTMNNDGNYYKIHNDNGSSDTANRVWTFVYYFHREPKAFTGGELLLYDSKIENNFYVAAKSYKTIQPKNNSVAVFLSRCLHEVLPVSCPSKQFLDSRFAVTGWVRN